MNQVIFSQYTIHAHITFSSQQCHLTLHLQYCTLCGVWCTTHKNNTFSIHAHTHTHPFTPTYACRACDCDTLSEPNTNTHTHVAGVSPEKKPGPQNEPCWTVFGLHIRARWDDEAAAAANGARIRHSTYFRHTAAHAPGAHTRTLIHTPSHIMGYRFSMRDPGPDCVSRAALECNVSRCAR